MYNKLNAKKIYILDDTETYGKGIADNVEKEFKAKGGTVLGHEGVPKGTQDYSTILTKIAVAAPQGDAIFYGGTTSNGLALARKQMVDARFRTSPSWAATASRKPSSPRWPATRVRAATQPWRP